MHRLERVLLTLLLPLALVSGCSWLPESADPTVGWDASQLYEEAHVAMEDGNYETALDYFTKLEARFPYGRLAQQAQMETIYAHYKADEPAAAIAAADRFIRLHPRHPNVDYAYYMRGLASFRPGSNFLERLFPRDQATRDPQAARESFRNFKELVTRHPDSKYSQDASQRMTFLRNELARHEVEVARFYLRREAHLAAAGRAREVVERYREAPAVADALAVLEQAYAAMDLQDLAADARRVRELNFPTRGAAAGAVGGGEEESLWSRMIPDLW